MLISGQPLDRRAMRDDEFVERRIAERRTTGACDGRRVEERRGFATTQDLLNAAAARHDGDRKFSGAPVTDFGVMA